MNVKTFLGAMTSAPTLALLAALAAGAWTTPAAAAPTTCAEADTTIGCCAGDVNYYCQSQAATTVSSMTCTGSTVCGWDTANGYYGCVASPGGSDPSGKHAIACGGSGGTSSGGASCGDTVGDATCNACVVTDCCAEATACSNDQFCPACIASSPPCATDPAATALLQCIDARCASACGVASTTSTSSGTATGTGGSGTTTYALVGNGACNASPAGTNHEGLAGMACVGALALAAAAARRPRRR